MYCTCCAHIHTSMPEYGLLAGASLRRPEFNPTLPHLLVDRWHLACGLSWPWRLQKCQDPWVPSLFLSLFHWYFAHDFTKLFSRFSRWLFDRGAERDIKGHQLQRWAWNPGALGSHFSPDTRPLPRHTHLAKENPRVPGTLKGGHKGVVCFFFLSTPVNVIYFLLPMKCQIKKQTKTACTFILP